MDEVRLQEVVHQEITLVVMEEVQEVAILLHVQVVVDHQEDILREVLQAEVQEVTLPVEVQAEEVVDTVVDALQEEVIHREVEEAQEEVAHLVVDVLLVEEDSKYN
jgi:hypothetical protein